METKVSIVNMAKEVAKEEVKVLTLSDKQRELLYNVIKSFNKADSSNKEFFCVLLALYKQGYTKGAIMLEVGRIVNQAKQGNELLARLRKMNELASKAYSHKVLLKVALAHFYNIEKSIKLFFAVSEDNQRSKEDKEEALKDIRETLFSCYDKEDTMVSYNNKVREAIINLRKKYHVIEVEWTEIVTNLKNKVLKLSKEEQKEIFEALKVSLNID